MAQLRKRLGECAWDFGWIPKEEKFYGDFLALADELKKGARLLEEMLAPDRPNWDKADEIKEVEHKCDFLTHEIIQRLNRTFVTPIDREDIHALARSLDDVMDAIDASASLVRLYRLDSVRFGARELAKIVTACTHEVHLALGGAREEQGRRRRTRSRSTGSKTRPTGCTSRPSAGCSTMSAIRSS